MRTVNQVYAAPNLAGGRIDLRWQNPAASDFAGGQPLARILLVRQVRFFARTPAEGVVVYDGAPITSFSDGNLTPLTTYYYTIFAVDAGGGLYTDSGARVAVFATQDYGLTEQLYRLLPAVHLRHDTQTFDAPPTPLPLRQRGQLRRFFDTIAAPFDLMRSFAEGLPDLHRPEVVRPEFLPALAHWVGWAPDRTLPLFAQRNEVRFAPTLYRTVGTVESLRTIVTRYTGWHAQATEFAQQIARSNVPPQYNIFALEADGVGGWQSAQDGSLRLGFGPGNDEAAGSGAVAATLTSTTSEPFALRPGMTLAVTADRRLPVAVRFEPADFVNSTAATAAEVSAVLNRTFSQFTTTVRAGRLVLTAHSIGADSALQVGHHATETITLEGAPDGRVSLVADPTDRLRLFYQTADAMRPLQDHAAAEAKAGHAIQSSRTSILNSQIRYKTLRAGRWGESLPLLPPASAPAAEPAAVLLPDGRLWVAYILDPHSDQATVHYVLGQPVQPTPARLTGQQGPPFVITPGATLMVRGNGPEPEGATLTAADFANPTAAQASEVRDALNARLRQAIVTVGPAGTLILTSVAVGADAALTIDLAHSTAATALGFTSSNGTARGDTGDVITWSAPQAVSPAGMGRHATPVALVDQNNVVWLFWSRHQEQRWQLVAARWDIATGTWLDTVPQAVGATVGQQREPTALLDGSNRIWLCWAQRATSAEGWRLVRRIFSGGAWGAEEDVITPAPPPGVELREPALLRLADGGVRLFFRANRSGGDDLWSVTIDPATAAVSTPVAVTSGAPADHWPAPVQLADGRLWLLYRSDRSIDLAREATNALPTTLLRRTLAPARVTPASANPGAAPPASALLPDGGTLHRFAGATSVTLTDTARNALRRARDDQLAYTPQNPRGDRPLREDEVYTRGTVGLYLSRIVTDNALSRQRVERLRTVLQRFLPINVRVVVILAPRVDVELIYPPDADIGERFQDNYPFVESYAGLEDNAMTRLPAWVQLLSNLAGHVTGDPAALASLRNRSYTPWLTDSS